MLILTARWRASLRRPTLAYAVLATGCGASEVATSETKPVNGQQQTIDLCDPPEVTLPDGSCIRPGILPGRCGEGFQHDSEYGCDPILPKDDCAAGTMAIPGETACRPVMPCGQGRWGDLPVDDATQYVDGSYAEGGSDGSEDKPWTTIGKAYEAAAPGALVAIAEGRYPEALRFEFKPIRIWGVCPEKVSVEVGGATGTIMLGPGSDESVIGGLAVTSDSLGILVTGAQRITLDRVWVHHTNMPGIIALRDLGPASLQVIGSLVEDAHDYGVFADGSDISMTDSVVRNTALRTVDQMLGGGFRAQMHCGDSGCDPSSQPIVSLDRCLIENNFTEGVRLEGADLTMTNSVIRRTSFQPADETGGHAMVLQVSCEPDGTCPPEQRARATITGCVIDDSYSAGILASGSDVTVDNTVIRDTKPQVSDDLQGAGVLLQAYCTAASCDGTVASNGTIRGSLIEKSHGSGLQSSASKAIVEDTVVRFTRPRQANGSQGLGIAAQVFCDHLGICDYSIGSDLTLSGSLVDDSYVAGLGITGSDAHLSSSVIRRTKARQHDGLYGDGLVLMGRRKVAAVTAVIEGLRIEDSARAGLANFATHAYLKDNSIHCAAFELVGQNLGTIAYRFEDEGGNRCGCPQASHPCKAVSADLEAPDFED